MLFRVVSEIFYISSLSLSLSLSLYIYIYIYIFIYVFCSFVCWILYDKRFSAFHFPVLDEDAPNYRSIIQNPMDLSTLLQRVDSGQFITCSVFLQEVDLIVSNAKVCIPGYGFYM
jgi:hypothetical protein